MIWRLLYTKNSVIPYLSAEAEAQAGLMRDPLSLIKAGDSTSERGMTVTVMSSFIERPFVYNHTGSLPNKTIL